MANNRKSLFVQSRRDVGKCFHGLCPKMSPQSVSQWKTSAAISGEDWALNENEAVMAEEEKGMGRDRISVDERESESGGSD